MCRSTLCKIKHCMWCEELHVHALPYQGDADSGTQCSPTDSCGFPVDL